MKRLGVPATFLCLSAYRRECLDRSGNSRQFSGGVTAEQNYGVQWRTDLKPSRSSHGTERLRRPASSRNLIEPGIVAPPLGKSFAEKWLAHLFRTGGVYRAPVAVERQTSRVEFESAMGQDLADADADEVLDQILAVANPKHPSRQDPIPMTHQL